MDLRKVIISGIAVLILAVIVISVSTAEEKQPAKTIASTQYIPKVEVLNVNLDTLRIPVALTGRLQAVNKLQLFAEVQGVASFGAHPFRKGIAFKKGETLLTINNEEMAYTVKALRAAFMNLIVAAIPDMRQIEVEWVDKWENYISNLSTDKNLADLPTVQDGRERQFLNARNLYQQYYSIKAQENRLAKYTLRAPFDGKLTAANINEGSLVNPNQALGEFTGQSYYEMESAVTLASANLLEVGNEATLHSSALDKSFDAKVLRIGNQVESSTQSVSVILGLKDAHLRDGMFLQGEVLGAWSADVVTIPRSALKDGSFVYVVKNQKLAKAEVYPIQYHNDDVIVRGLKQGDQLLLTDIAGTYEGMPVAIKK